MIMSEFDIKPDVLVVEENQAIAELYINAIQANTSRVIWMHSVAEALDFLRAQGQYINRNIQDRPRVIFIDIQNPTEDVYGFIRAIKSNDLLKRIPVVALTASKDESHIIEYYKIGGNSFVIRPESEEELKILMEQISRYWLSVNSSSN
jgi:CheY-like chemotaxis protein